MKSLRFLSILTFAALSFLPLTALGQDLPPEYAAGAKLLGRTGDFKDGVFKVGIPRNDLHVTIQGKPMPTPFGFAGWIALSKGADSKDVLMGDLVLTQDEVNPVISALQAAGLQVHALHNHFFFEEPRLFYLHIHGHNSAELLFQAVKPALDLIGKGQPTPASTTAAIAPVFSFDTASLDKIVGRTGDKFGSVYKYTVGRDDLHLTEHGAPINARMGLNSWAALAGNDSAAQIAGDIAMRDSEVNAVLQALRARDINIVAIHNHMLAVHGEEAQPHIVFLHYWGAGKATDLAQAFRDALDILGK